MPESKEKSKSAADEAEREELRKRGAIKEELIALHSDNQWSGYSSHGVRETL